jgi:Phosphatidylglycerol lysyltransferase, C-terminal
MQGEFGDGDIAPTAKGQVCRAAGSAPPRRARWWPIDRLPSERATSPLMTIPLDIRLSLLRQHGNFALANSVTFQPGLEHFGDDAGFLSYKTVGRTALVLSNPITALDKRRALINRFIEEKGDICFWQISRPVAEILASLGFSINEMGTESHINLANYNFAGPELAKRNLRRAYNRMLNRGYTTCECPAATLNSKELEAVSVKWRRTRSVKNREITFLVRPVVLEDELDVRKFFTFDRDGYYGVPHNWRALNGFLREVRRIWITCLKRRSQTNRNKGWDCAGL